MCSRCAQFKKKIASFYVDHIFVFFVVYAFSSIQKEKRLSQPLLFLPAKSLRGSNFALL